MDYSRRACSLEELNCLGRGRKSDLTRSQDVSKTEKCALILYLHIYSFKNDLEELPLFMESAIVPNAGITCNKIILSLMPYLYYSNLGVLQCLCCFD